MAVKAARVLVSSGSAVVVGNGNDLDGIAGVAKNLTSTAVVYLGGADVTASTGYPWDGTQDGAFPFEVKSGEMLYGITAAGDPDQTIATLANTQ